MKLCVEYIDLLVSGKVTPIAMARWNSNHSAAKVAENLQDTPLVDIESTDRYGSIPLMNTFASRKLELCKLLIRYGADLSKDIYVFEYNEPACLVSTGFPAEEVFMLEALLYFSHSIERTF